MQAPEPQKEHQWLQKLVGKWTFESECPGGPDQPPMKTSGSETVRSVGGFWIIGDGQGTMPGGGDAVMQLSLGYDPQKKKFVGTWLGSMMTMLWIYEGSLDESGTVLTLDTTGPNFTDPTKTARYQDVITIKGDNERTLASRSLGDDGKWHQFMLATYRRTK